MREAARCDRTASQLLGALTRAGAPVLSALRMYRGTALLLAATGTLALASLVPIASLWHPGAGTVSSLGFDTVRGGDLGLPWVQHAHSPAANQQAAVTALFHLLLGCAGAVLAVAALTILTLSAARASERVPEIAIRRAVGASRGSILIATLFEAGVVAAAALLAGAAIGMPLSGLAAARWPGVIGAAGRSGTSVALLSLVGAILLGGILPVAFARRTRLTEADPKPLPLLIPAIQLGLSLIVLAASALVVRHAAALAATQRLLGGNGEVYQITLPNTSIPERSQRLAALLERVEEKSGTTAISLTSPGAIGGLGTVAGITTDCGLCSQGTLMVPWRQVLATHEMVSADTFRALGTKLIAGRGISPTDDWGAPRVAVVNRALAAQHFQHGEAIGRQLMVGFDKSDWYTVVGVVEDKTPSGFGGALQPDYTVYLSLLQHPTPEVDLLLQGSRASPATSAIGQVAAETLGAGPGAVRQMDETALLQAEVAPLRWFGRWFGLEGWVGLVIGLMGTLTLMRLWVLSLSGELGLRRAVGARRWQVLGWILGRSLVVGLVGCGFGLWFGPALWNSLGSSVEGLPAWDSGIVGRLALLLIGATMVGALLPAWQAVRMGPARLLGLRD